MLIMFFVLLGLSYIAAVFNVLFRMKSKSETKPKNIAHTIFIVLIVLSTICLTIIASSAQAQGGIYEYFVNGFKVGENFISSDKIKIQNIVVTAILAGPLLAIVLLFLAFVPARIISTFILMLKAPKVRKLRLGYLIWSVFCIPGNLLGLIPLYYALKASRVETNEAEIMILKKCRIWCLGLTVFIALYGFYLYNVLVLQQL